MKTRIHTIITSLAMAGMAVAAVIGMTPAGAAPSEAPNITRDASPRKVVPKHTAPEAVSVTAHDLLTKVYGVVDPSCNHDETVTRARESLSMTPAEDLYGMWLDGKDGYRVDYYGMSPEVSAMVRFGEDDSVMDFGYFFFFPYENENRKAVNDSQSEFCRVLLQELHDIGAQLDQATHPEALFDVVGRYEDNFLEVQLVEETVDWQLGDGIFVVSMRISPQAFSSGTEMMASE